MSSGAQGCERASQGRAGLEAWPQAGLLLSGHTLSHVALSPGARSSRGLGWLPETNLLWKGVFTAGGRRRTGQSAPRTRGKNHNCSPPPSSASEPLPRWYVGLAVLPTRGVPPAPVRSASSAASSLTGKSDGDQTSFHCAGLWGAGLVERGLHPSGGMAVWRAAESARGQQIRKQRDLPSPSSFSHLLPSSLAAWCSQSWEWGEEAASQG